MIELVDNILDEISYAGVKRKQRSITRLFPPFYGRVQAVADKGGVRLRDVEPDLWKFKIHSGTQDDVWYDGYVKFRDLLDVLRTGVMDRRMWTKSKEHVNLRKLAKHVLYKVNLQLLCSCPAFQYWGPAYIMSLDRYDGKFGDRETRPPRIRNPKQYGAICKHMEAVMKVLPFYESSMAKYLRQFYADEIAEYEEAAKEQYGWIKRAAKALGRKGKEKPEKPEREPGEEGPEKERPGRKKKVKKKVERPKKRRRPRRPSIFKKRKEKEEAEAEARAKAKEEEEEEETKESVREDTDLEAEKLRWFISRTNRHIDLVRRSAEKIVSTYPEFEELLQRTEIHDASKFEEPERTPYIEISWKYKIENEGGIKIPPSEEENNASLHHITTNSHHPEYHTEEQANVNSMDRDESDECVDVTDMPDLDIAEMIADWQAMSVELKKNTAREWFDRQKDVRWHFSNKQERLIDRLLGVFEIDGLSSPSSEARAELNGEALAFVMCGSLIR